MTTLAFCLLALSIAANVWVVRILVREMRRRPIVYLHDNVTHIDGVSEHRRAEFIRAVDRGLSELGHTRRRTS